MLKSFLLCKRQFYYRYVAKLSSKLELEPPAATTTIGTHLHAVLAEAYKNKTAPVEALKKAALKALIERTRNDARLAFEASLWEAKWAGFWQSEADRLTLGWQPFALEETFSAPHEGILLQGRIDRADRLADRVMVLDYKSGKIPDLKAPEKTVDFQLYFYHRLLQAQGYDAIDAAYYELQTGKLHTLPDPEAYEAVFNAHLAAFKAPHHRFDRCESRAPCRTCDYALVCGRAL